MNNNKKILLAEDMELFLEMEKYFLQRDDLDLVICSGGAKIFDMLREHAPQLALLGMRMPGMSGPECCRAIKSDKELSATAVVLMFEAGRPEHVEQARQAGCDDVLFKPIKHDEFLAMVRRYVPVDVRDGKRMRAQLRVSYGPEPQKPLTEYSVDLSAGGIYLQTNFPLAVGESLTLRFTLPDMHKMVTCQARVAWVNSKESPRKPDFPAGMGVQFVDMSLEDIKSIRRFLEYNELEPSW